MSHFSLLVIGDDIEGQLEHYNENREVAPYRSGTDEEVQQELRSALAFLVERESDKRIEHLVGAATTIEELTLDQQASLLNWYVGGGVEVEDGKVVKYSTYNKDSKWDWYSIGGRWNGYFPLKEGASGLPVEPHYSERDNPPDKSGRTDQARKGDIDFELMRTEAAVKAAEEFQAMQEATKDAPPLTEGWEALSDRHLGDLAGEQYWDLTDEAERDAYNLRLDQAREEWNAIPFVQALRKFDPFIMGDPYKIYCMDAPDPQAEYVRRARASAVAPYAMLINGEWVAQGEMGWFGMSNDEVDQATWNDKVDEVIDGLPDDTLITLIDCHV